MNRKIILTVLLLYVFINSFSQEYSVYISDGKKGIINSVTNEVTVKPIYDKIIQIYDTIFVAKLNDKYGVVSVHGNVIYDFIFEDKLRIQTEEYPTNGEIYVFIKSGKDKKFFGFYYIDNKNNCVCDDYAPCPPTKNFDTLNLPDYLLLRQKAFSLISSGEIDTGLVYLQKSIDVAPEIASSYAWYSWTLEFNPNIDKKVVSENQQTIENNYIKACDLEHNDYFKLVNKNSLYQYYDRKLFKYKKRNEVEKDILKNYNVQINKTGLVLQTGVSFTNSFLPEIGIVYVNKDFLNKKFKNSEYSSIDIFGITYSKYLNKEHLIKIHCPLTIMIDKINFVLYPILVTTDFRKFNFGMRPELGFYYKWFNFAIGYNILSKKNDTNFKGFYAGISTNLFIFSNKYFYSVK